MNTTNTPQQISKARCERIVKALKRHASAEQEDLEGMTIEEFIASLCNDLDNLSYFLRSTDLPPCDMWHYPTIRQLINFNKAVINLIGGSDPPAPEVIQAELALEPVTQD